MEKKRNKYRAEKATSLTSGSFLIEAKKSLGQNFLIDKNTIAKIAFFSKEISKKTCLEIGPGAGALTKKLLELGLKVHALEKDERAVQGLKETLGVEFPSAFTIEECDVLKWKNELLFDGEKTACVGNLPYYITSDILLWFLASKRMFSGGLFMVQNEVADRLCASPGNKSYGRLTVRVQLEAEVEKMLFVPRSSFAPAPNVDSAVIKITPKENSPITPEIEARFSNFTTVLFSQRRKMLRRSLNSLFPSEAAAEKFWATVEEFGVTSNLRPEVLSPEQIWKMFVAS